MNRRDLLKWAILTGGAAFASPVWPAAFAPDNSVKRVLVVTLCHLDVGFTQTQAQVLRKYFDVYYPEAMQRAAELRHAGGDRFVWTTSAWLLSTYLEQASSAQRKVIEQAISAGDLAWHAMPFNWQTEMLDRSMIEGCMAFSATLDRQFGAKTIGGKMTDVPGHSRGLIAPLHAAGIRLLDIGVNAGSTPPQVPELFLWKNPAGQSLAVMCHRHDYGGLVRIPDTDVAVDIEVRTDNSGPFTAAEIAGIYAALRTRFPDAQVTASTMSAVASAVEAVRDRLPVVTQEIGDTWIYGVGSDPVKVARYRELARLRKSWIAEGRFSVGDETDRKLLRHLALAPEHTWGADTKRYLDYDHYRPEDLRAVLSAPGYKTMAFSWQEKRDDLDAAIAALPPALQEQALAHASQRAPAVPPSYGLSRHPPSEAIKTPHYLLGFDPGTGALTRLKNRSTGREWASPHRPLALFTYQTLSAAEYADFIARYVTSKADWAVKDFGKPGIEKFGARASEWHPAITHCWTASYPHASRVLLEMHIEDRAAEATGNVAWPSAIYLDLHLPAAEPRIDLTLTAIGVRANRLPEAMWLTFQPDAAPQGRWTVEKVDETIDALDVVRGGGRAMHALTETLRYQDAQGSFAVHTLDAPLVALGLRSPLNFSMDLPDLALGAHFNLFNNCWGTNYVQWASGDWSYRFSVIA